MKIEITCENNVYRAVIFDGDQIIYIAEYATFQGLLVLLGKLEAEGFCMNGAYHG